MSQNHVDVLIVGAGISGIGVAAHLTREAPQKKFAILERRKAIGGTWDLFRYPGIRSDSDMSTFGYEFRPWTESKVLADGPAIRGYVNDTAKEYKISDKIHFDRHVKTADWSSKNKVWTLTVENTETGKAEQWTANFLIGCTGYYNYDEGFQPDYPGQDKFKGQFIHPQHWPENLDYAGKKVVIIGSGATAITLVPAMAPTAGHVTMLQRSPTYIASIPAIDPVFDKMKILQINGYGRQNDRLHVNWLEASYPDACQAISLWKPTHL
jgi:monooxygenase